MKSLIVLYNLEQVSFVIRFVDSDKSIRQDFLRVITVKRIPDESLATALLSWLEEHNILLDVSFFEGASNVIQHCRCTNSDTFSVPNGLLHT